MTDQEMVDHALMMTASAPADKKGCRLIAILCYIEIGEDPLFVSGSIEGTLTDKQETDIMPGYPFRSIMRLNEGGKIYTEVSEEELRDLSHRLKALNKLRQKLEL